MFSIIRQARELEAQLIRQASAFRFVIVQVKCDTIKQWRENGSATLCSIELREKPIAKKRDAKARTDYDVNAKQNDRVRKLRAEVYSMYVEDNHVTPAPIADKWDDCPTFRPVSAA